MKKGRRLLVVMIMLCLPILGLAIFCGANIAKASTCVVAINGGSIYLTSGANMTMDGSARISGSSGENGGAIYIGDGATLTMTGGIIDSCSATNGGAIYIASGGTFIFNGGTISNCMANLGYAIYVQEGGNLVIGDGVFSNCGENDSLHIYYEGLKVTPYIDGVAQESFMIKSTTVFSEITMPLSDEECCGWFYDEHMLDSVHYDQVLDATGQVNLYTKSATIDKLTFTLNSSDDTYRIQRKSKSISGVVVVPRMFEGKQITGFTSWTGGNSSIVTGFYDAPNITCVYFPNTIVNLSGQELFGLCTKLEEIYICDTVTSAFRGVNGGLESLSKIVVSEKNEYYDSRNNCNAVIETATNTMHLACKTTIIPDSVDIIDSAYRSNSSITSIQIPYGVTRLEWVSFNCDKLTNVTIPDSVNYMCDAFKYCTSLRSIYIPSSVKTIEASTYTSSSFLGCSSSIKIYCGASSKPSGWDTYWNYRNSTSRLATYWGYTREEYEQAVGLSSFASSQNNEDEIESDSNIQITSIKPQNDIYCNVNESSVNLNVILNERKEYVVFEKRKLANL